MPRPGQMTEECTLLTWHKNEGDPVARGDVLFEIETDKAVMEVEAFDDGVLLRRVVEEGQTVAVNSVCAYVGQPGEAIPEPVPVPVPAPASVHPPEAAPASAPEPATAAAVVAPPAARVSPRASRLAAELGVDARTLIGSGPDGRIVERDVRAAATAPGAPTATGRQAPEVVPVWASDEGEPQPLSRMRRAIAQRMSYSATTVPQFAVTVAVDVTRLIAMRDELKAVGTPLTVTDFVMVAAAGSLVEMPVINSRTDGQSVWLRRRVHLGLAVSVPNGLVVVVVRDADHLSLDEIHQRAASLAAAARDGTLPADEMSGSTLTISNLGMHDVEHFTALINPGESAILAVGSAAREPVVIGDGLAIRWIMRLTLTADHRLVDGELAAQFLDDLRRRLQDPAGLRGPTPDLEERG